MLSKVVNCNSNVLQTGSGAKPLAAGQFLVSFLKKKAILIPLDHVSQVFRAI